MKKIGFEIGFEIIGFEIGFEKDKKKQGKMLLPPKNKDLRPRVGS